MTKRCLVFNCAGRFGKAGMGSILFRFYLLTFLLGSQGILLPVDLPVESRGQMNSWPQGFTGGKQNGRGSTSPADCASPAGSAFLPPPTPVPFCSSPHPSSLPQDKLGPPPPCVSRCFHRGRPGSSQHRPQAVCGAGLRGGGAEGVKVSSPIHPSFLSLPVLLRWLTDGGTLQDPSVPQCQAGFWPRSSLILPRCRGLFHPEEACVTTGPALCLWEEPIQVVAAVAGGCKVPRVLTPLGSEEISILPKPRGLLSEAFSLSQ